VVVVVHGGVQLYCIVLISGKALLSEGPSA
jgi:hypothetical protein